MIDFLSSAISVISFFFVLLVVVYLIVRILSLAIAKSIYQAKGTKQKGENDESQKEKDGEGK